MDQNAEQVLAALADRRPPAMGLYLHIPFCRRKCPYCDFYSLEDTALIHDYLDALLAQMAEFSAACAAYRVDTVFFGGGTPSLLTERQWNRLLSGVQRHFRILPDTEVTVEVNPDSATPKLLKALHRAGVNRLSIGVQSFDDTLLSAIGRLHDAKTATDTVRAAQKAGFDNITLDLMYGLPQQTLAQFEQSIRSAVALGVTHLSAYGLKVEENTPFGRMGDALLLPDDDTFADQYLLLCQLAREAGYFQYEISNFAKPGCASRHNLKYWVRDPYLGLGPGAHSFFDGWRFAFNRDLKGYIRCYRERKQRRHDLTPLLQERRRISEQEAMEETIMLSLRLTAGLDEPAFAQRFGCRFSELVGQWKLAKYERAGLLKRTEGHTSLTPQGFAISNLILADLLDWDERATP